jgi:hypothetical protein
MQQRQSVIDELTEEQKQLEAACLNGLVTGLIVAKLPSIVGMGKALIKKVELTDASGQPQCAEDVKPNAVMLSCCMLCSRLPGCLASFTTGGTPRDFPADGQDIHKLMVTMRGCRTV